MDDLSDPDKFVDKKCVFSYKMVCTDCVCSVDGIYADLCYLVHQQISGLPEYLVLNTADFCPDTSPLYVALPWRSQNLIKLCHCTVTS